MKGRHWAAGKCTQKVRSAGPDTLGFVLLGDAEGGAKRLHSCAGAVGAARACKVTPDSSAHSRCAQARAPTTLLCCAGCIFRSMLSGFQGNAGLFALEDTVLATNRVGAGMIGAAFALSNVTWSGNTDDAVADNETAVFADASSAPRTYSVGVSYQAYGPVRNVTALPLAASAQLPFLSGADTSFGALRQVRLLCFGDSCTVISADTQGALFFRHNCAADGTLPQ